MVFYFHNPRGLSHTPPENQNSTSLKNWEKKNLDPAKKCQCKKPKNRSRVEDGYKRESIFIESKLMFPLVEEKMNFNSQLRVAHDFLSNTMSE